MYSDCFLNPLNLLKQGSDGDPDVMPISNIEVLPLVDHYLKQEDVDNARKERNKALELQEEYKSRCKKAEEQYENEQLDKEAVKKSLNKKITKLTKDLTSMQTENEALLKQLNEVKANLERETARFSELLAKGTVSGTIPESKGLIVVGMNKIFIVMLSRYCIAKWPTNSKGYSLTFC